MLPTHNGLSKVEGVLELGEWAWSPEHGELCRVIETQAFCGETVGRNEL